MIENRVVKNASWIIVAQIFRVIFSIIVSSLTARYLGPSDFGVLNYAMSLVSFLIPIMQLGFSAIIVKELISNPEEEGKILGTAILGNFISGILCVIGLIIFVNVYNHGENTLILVTSLYSMVLIVESFSIISFWFQAKLLSKYTSLVTLFAYVVVSIYKIVLLVLGKSVVWFSIANVLDYLLINSFLFIIYKRKSQNKLSFSFKIFKRMFSASKYYIFTGIMVTIFLQTDRIMIKNLLGDEATGLYSVCISCATMTSFFFAAIIDSARPIIFENRKRNIELFNNNITYLYGIIIYLCIAQNIVVSIFSKLIIWLLYGDSYLVAAPALSVLIWYTLFSYVGSVRNVWLLAENKSKYIVIIDSVGAIFNIFANFIFIKYMGIMGAALASVCTQFISNIVVVSLIKDSRINVKLILKSLNPVFLFKQTKLFLNRK